VSEWRLFEAGTVPGCSTPRFFEVHPWVPPEAQAGHAERTAMVREMVSDIVRGEPGLLTLSDLGCGDGRFLASLKGLGLRVWGYDAGRENVQKAAEVGLDVQHRDILRHPLVYGSLVTCCEVVEHLHDPHGFLSGLRMHADRIILSSPSAEDDQWHYADHTWAWDLEGYAALVSGSGWEVVEQRECDGGVNHHFGVERPQRFQAIYARRAGSR